MRTLGTLSAGGGQKLRVNGKKREKEIIWKERDLALDSVCVCMFA